MTQDEFWDLIGMLEPDAEASDEEIVKPLLDVLVMKHPHEIEAFDDLLSEKLFALDGKKFAEQSGTCAQYEDLFLACRCCAVARGREYYDAVLKDPSLMPENTTFEPLADIAADAFEKKTGFDYHHRPAYSMEMYANQSQW